MYYDCFRAIVYKYFNIRLRTDQNTSLLITYLYDEQDVKLPIKAMAKKLGSKGKGFLLEDRSLREIVLLHCNSDIVLRNLQNNDFYSLYMLPKRTFIEIVSNNTSFSWTETNARNMRIFYYKTLYEGVESVLSEAVLKIKNP